MAQGHDEVDFGEQEDPVPQHFPVLQDNKNHLSYPFSIALTTEEKIDMVAKDFLSFKQWVNGINILVKYKKKLSKLKTRIESYTSV